MRWSPRAASTSTGSSAAHRTAPCCTTPAGSATRPSSPRCWPAAPIRWPRRRATATRRRRGRAARLRRARGAERGPPPLAWTAVASQSHETPGRDYVAVAELLTAAGATVDPSLLGVADGPLADWLEERLAA